MEGQIEPELVDKVHATQKLLGEFIQKPVLLEKYLQKPPFRFLHEIFTNVIETTGFMKNVFTQNELKYEKITNVEDKRSFLKKVIDAIESECEEKCDVRPSKILSGKEPDKTNDMLQSLAKAIGIFTAKSSKDATSISKDSKSKSQKKADEIRSKVPSKATKDLSKDKDPKSRPSASAVPSKNSQKPSPEEIDKKKLESKVSGESEILHESSSPQKSGQDVPKHPKQPVKSIDDHKKQVPQAKPKPVGRKESALTLSSKGCKPVVLPIKPSALTKSKSKLSLPKKSDFSKQNSTDSKEVLHIEENHEPGEEMNTKISSPAEPSIPMEKVEESPSNTSISAAAINHEEIPRRRPVTRTKYRQNSETNSSNPSKESLLGGKRPLSQQKSDMTKSKSQSQESIKKSPIKPLSSNQDEKESEEVKGHDHGSSSDEGVTEEMNDKISEWKAHCASATDAGSVEDVNFQTCWIPPTSAKDGEQANPPSRVNANSAMDKVFESNENFEEFDEGKQGSRCGVPRQDQPLQVDREFGEKRKEIQVIKPHSSQPQANRRPITVMMDDDGNDDDDDAFLVQEKVESEKDFTLDRLQTALINTASDMSHIPPEERGLLVNQIMETQRELEQLASQKKLFSDLQNEMAERDREALREVYLKQIEDLKGALQKMAKCANPIANIIQRSQDDACLMEIEYRKLRQENERLQRSIDEAKAETLKTLCPLTEELSHLDSRIEKMEAAIVLAKQRLHIMDEEYFCDYIYPIGQCPVPEEGEEEEQGTSEVKKPIWEFAGGSSSDDENTSGKREDERKKSLLNVFQKAISMHENETRNATVEKVSSHNLLQMFPPSQVWPRFEPQQRDQVEKRKTTIKSGRSVGKSRGEGGNCVASFYEHHNRISGKQLFGEQKERTLAKDIKPPWWD